MERREVFDTAAGAYDEVRPRYPEALVEDVVRLSRIPEQGNIVEIGCGTGQATLAFARRGYVMTCVEPGEHLAALAERNLAPYPGATVRRGLFEDCPLPESTFDLAISATAIHHVRADMRYAKTVKLLKPTGAIALFWNWPGEWEAELRQRVDQAYRRHSPEGAQDFGAWPLERRIAVTGAEIGASGCFGDMEVRRYPWTPSYTAEQYMKLLDTYSGHARLPPEAKSGLYGAIKEIIVDRGGTIETPLVAVLFLASVRSG